MALVIPPPTAIPNALNPTTAAVERDAEKREITPAVTPDSASASTADSTAEKDFVNYQTKKDAHGRKKKPAKDHATQIPLEDDSVVLEHAPTESGPIADKQTTMIFSVDMNQPPEIIIAEVLLIRQAILAKSKLNMDDRQRLAEINHIIKTALADLLRLKQLDEVKTLASQLPHASGVLKGEGEHSDVIALDDLFACSFADDIETNTVSAKAKLAGAVVGYFYGENIEPQPPSQIDHQE